MAQQLKALGIIAEALGSIPVTIWFTVIRNSSSSGSGPVLGTSLGIRHVLGMHTHRQARRSYTHSKVILKTMGVEPVSSFSSCVLEHRTLVSGVGSLKMSICHSYSFPVCLQHTRGSTAQRVHVTVRPQVASPLLYWTMIAHLQPQAMVGASIPLSASLQFACP